MNRFLGTLALLALGCARDAIDVPQRRPVPHPAVVLRSPHLNAVIPWNAAIAIKADVRDIPGAVVEFAASGHPIARDDSPPYEASYRPKVAGPVVITAQVRDGRGNVIAGDAVPVEVENPDPRTDTDELTLRDVTDMMEQPPIAIITTPADGVELRRGPVHLNGEATGIAAGVVRVEFLIDGVASGTRQIPPTEPAVTFRFEQVWEPGRGVHSIAVRAVDAGGRVGVSKPINVTVK